MKEYTITEDRAKLILYTVGNLFITLVLMVITMYFFTTGLYLIAFFGVTGMWFSVKSMIAYGLRLFKKKPICSFKQDEVILYSLHDGEIVMKYNEIEEAKLLIDFKSVKLFFSGKKVQHPSGWNYVAAVYLFKRNLLEEVQAKTIECLKSHNIKYSVQQQTRR